MRTLIKRTVMWLYCREYIKAQTVVRMFAKFNLWGA